MTNFEHSGVIVQGIERARTLGLDKPADLAISIIIELQDHGYRITRIPRHGRKETGNQEKDYASSSPNPLDD